MYTNVVKCIICAGINHFVCSAVSEHASHLCRLVSTQLITAQSSLLAKRLHVAVDVFRAMDKDNSMFTPDFDVAFNNAMQHAQQGCVSDPPNENLYTDITRPDGQVVRYTCSRVCYFLLALALVP